jgi:hypothetical protein
MSTAYNLQNNLFGLSKKGIINERHLTNKRPNQE